MLCLFTKSLIEGRNRQIAVTASGGNLELWNR